MRASSLRRFSRPNPSSQQGSSTFSSSGSASSSSSSSTFSGGGGGSSSAQPQRMKKVASGARWSYDLQDAPSKVWQALHNIDHGYVARVAAVFGVLGGGFWVMYSAFCKRQDQQPLAKRWGWIAPRVPITLIERTPIAGTKLEVFRFALPNSYDYAGYEPVSSVRVYVDSMKTFMPIARWFTPISHPEERGIIEFAIKECDPGRMSARLRYLKPGDRLYLGRWMKEFPYKPNTYGDLGLICSSGGSSVALQLLKVMEADQKDRTKLSLLFCHHSAAAIPFEDTFAGYMRRNPQRFKISYNVLSHGKRKTPIAGDAKVQLGLIDDVTVLNALPPPVQLADRAAVANRDRRFVVNAEDDTLLTDPSLPVPHKTSVLVCGPMSFMAGLCGRPQPLFNYTYMQPMFYKYRGVLKDLGYERKNVYKFGVSTHYLAYHD